ncbi:cysteine--tRNA ligase [Micropruina sonneratiae]|uniref:cysteine--tRNA ligase n=1 Tax=Micropruina sonneratiae TaxID=2986940 RepID=UPI002225C0BC|nr:cysteine--tRNA ligase [Micropruina sp. KQZ13P-5]MCW3158932.1 cysteine--tRNA ligase [Micropruina sp. KQZ13P-5]
MSVHLYDSLRREIVEFEPIRPGEASIYVCGPTVQGAPHLGHLRSRVNFDVLRRWLEYSGLTVTLVSNVTDIDDKILAKAADAGHEWWAHAYRYEQAFGAAFRSLGVPATYEPRATGHVPEMIELIAELIERGHAYRVEGTADVYFDVASWPAYGELTGQRADELEPAEGDDPRGKHDPRDFALWKSHKASEPETASWPSPWGRGRPGWHIECSAMAGKYLGDTFDIHGGGLDLRFPHHENELAQSRAAGRGFARYWLHNAWVTMAGEKMSKSLGNTADVAAAVATHGGRAVRLWLAGPHYRSAIELSEDALAEAAAQLARIDSFLERSDASASAPAGEGTWVAYASEDDVLSPEFVAAMDNDLGTPTALAVLFGRVRDGNRALERGDAAEVTRIRLEVRLMLDVFGLEPSRPEWAGIAGSGDDLTPVVDGLVGALLEQRAQARARKDWPAADAIRDTLKQLGLKVEDTPNGPRWSLEA